MSHGMPVWFKPLITFIGNKSLHRGKSQGYVSVAVFRSANASVHRHFIFYVSSLLVLKQKTISFSRRGLRASESDW